MPAKIFSLKFLLLSALVFFTALKALPQAATNTVLRLAVAGATHGHVPLVLGHKKPDITIVGIYEPNKELSLQLAKTYGLSASIFFTDLNTMLDKVQPEAVAAFGSIYEHRAVVEACAPRGIHVMVEKPLSTNITDAPRMEQLAKKHNIQLLTNFETSWYASTAKTYQLVNDSNFLGKVRRVVIHDGHNGPKEIGVPKEFFEWLTDPVQNGGGALIDFGCYGANLMTYLMKGEKPISVTAVTRQFKPGIYPKVDDDATILVNYPSAECVIQASWNWPFSRKDMEVYGETGYIFSDNATDMRLRQHADKAGQTLKVSAQQMNVYDDPISYFADVVKGRIKVPSFGLYSLETNVEVVRILDAARRSAKTGKTVMLKGY